MQTLWKSLNNKEEMYMSSGNMQLSFLSIFDPHLFESPIIEATDTED